MNTRQLNDEETCDNRDAVPWKDPKNTIDEKCEQLGSFKENRNNKDNLCLESETVEISGALNQERMLEEFDTQLSY